MLLEDPCNYEYPICELSQAPNMCLLIYILSAPSILMPTPGGNFAESWILRLRHVTGVFWVSGQVHRHLGECLAHQVEWEASHARTQLFRLFSAGWTWSIVSALLSFSNALGCTGIYANRKKKPGSITTLIVLWVAQFCFVTSSHGV